MSAFGVWLTGSSFNMVGSNYHNPEKDSRIVRAIWHPLGVEGASLLVLTSESIVRFVHFLLYSYQSAVLIKSVEPTISQLVRILRSRYPIKHSTFIH